MQARCLPQTWTCVQSSAEMRLIMKKETGVNIDINVTKIVKYVCFAGVIIVTIVFLEKGFKEFMKNPFCINNKER